MNNFLPYTRIFVFPTVYHIPDSCKVKIFFCWCACPLFFIIYGKVHVWSPFWQFLAIFDYLWKYALSIILWFICVLKFQKYSNKGFSLKITLLYKIWFDLEFQKMLNLFFESLLLSCRKAAEKLQKSCRKAAEKLQKSCWKAAEKLLKSCWKPPYNNCWSL